MNTDPIADLLTRIRNAQKAGHASLTMPSSKIKVRVAELMRDEGYIGDVSVKKEGILTSLTLHLKYDTENVGVIDGVERVSSPGLRVYSGHEDLPSVRGGLGMSIVSTSRGLMTDKEARVAKVGGEVLCRVW